MPPATPPTDPTPPAASAAPCRRPQPSRHPTPQQARVLLLVLLLRTGTPIAPGLRCWRGLRSLLGRTPARFPLCSIPGAKSEHSARAHAMHIPLRLSGLLLLLL
eukprot:scaffold29088_cov18-Tisochrysis_lutea.AAC.4